MLLQYRRGREYLQRNIKVKIELYYKKTRKGLESHDSSSKSRHGSRGNASSTRIGLGQTAHSKQNATRAACR